MVTIENQTFGRNPRLQLKETEKFFFITGNLKKISLVMLKCLCKLTFVIGHKINRMFSSELKFNSLDGGPKAEGKKCN